MDSNLLSSLMKGGAHFVDYFGVGVVRESQSALANREGDRKWVLF